MIFGRLGTHFGKPTFVGGVPTNHSFCDLLVGGVPTKQCYLFAYYLLNRLVNICLFSVYYLFSIWLVFIYLLFVDYLVGILVRTCLLSAYCLVCIWLTKY